MHEAYHHADSTPLYTLVIDIYYLLNDLKLAPFDSYIPVLGSTAGSLYPSGTVLLLILSLMISFLISPSSISHVLLHPSQLNVLSSSHISPTSMIPLPHTGSSSTWQVLLHPSPLLVLPSSHCSTTPLLVSTLPFPQVILLDLPPHPDPQFVLLVIVIVCESLHIGYSLTALNTNVLFPCKRLTVLVNSPDPLSERSSIVSCSSNSTPTRFSPSTLPLNS